MTVSSTDTKGAKVSKTLQAGPPTQSILLSFTVIYSRVSPSPNRLRFRSGQRYCRGPNRDYYSQCFGNKKVG